MEPNVMRAVFANGNLPSTGNVTLAMQGAPVPCGCSLDSTAVGRSIQLSIDNGVNFFTPQYDNNTTAFLGVSVRSPVTHVSFNGNAGDAWRVI